MKRTIAIFTVLAAFTIPIGTRAQTSKTDAAAAAKAKADFQALVKAQHTLKNPPTLLGHVLGEPEPRELPPFGATTIQDGARCGHNGHSLDENPNTDFDCLLYEDGKLAKYSGFVNSKTMSEVRADAVKKLGKPTNVTNVPMHNGFGVTWTDTIIGWDIPGGHIELKEHRNPTGSDDFLKVETLTHLEEELAAHAAEPNALN